MACQSSGTGPALGGLLGGDSRPEPTTAGLADPASVGSGTVIGGIAQSDLAQTLEPADLAAAAQAEYAALEATPAGTEHAWSGPGGASGIIVPGEPYEIAGTRCRDYTHTLTLGSGPRVLRGTACRRSDGTWRQVGA